MKVEPLKSRDQEKRYHAMIADIARVFVHAGRKWNADDMKRLLIDQFRRDTIKDPELLQEWRKVSPIDLVPSIDGSGVVMLGAQSRRFTKKLACAFCDWLFAFGAEINVTWSDPTVIPLAAYQVAA